MTNAEYKRRLDELIFICGMNSRYHQDRKLYFTRWDRGIRIAVGTLAIIGLVVAFPGVTPAAVGVVVAIISLVAAVVLNIIPVSDWSRDHSELFRLWSDLRKDAVIEEHETCEAEDAKDATPAHFRRLCELINKSELLHVAEPAPDRELLRRCYGDEMESLWGNGIRTFEQAEAARIRNHCPTSVSAVASEEMREQAPAADV